MNNDDLEILVEEVIKKSVEDAAVEQLTAIGYDLEAVKKIVLDAFDRMKAAGVSFKSAPSFIPHEDGYIWNNMAKMWVKKRHPSYVFEASAEFAKPILLPEPLENTKQVDAIKFQITYGGPEAMEVAGGGGSVVEWFIPGQLNRHSKIVRWNGDPMGTVSKVAEEMADAVIEMKTRDVSGSSKNDAQPDASKLKYNNETGMLEPKG